MATCKRCGRSGIFLRLENGICKNCLLNIAHTEVDIQQLTAAKDIAQKALDEVQEKLQNRATILAQLEADAKASGIKQAEDAMAQQLAEAERTARDQIAKADAARNELANLEKEIIETRDEITLQSFGLYRPHFSLMNADEYKSKLLEIRAKQKEMIKEKKAVSGATNWTVNGSLPKGKKMVSDTQKLLLRAFNAECDDVVEHVKYNNVEAGEKRITASCDAISKLGDMMNIRITPRYYKLKLDELHLAFEYQQKKQEEKEAIKEARAQMREEAKLAKEIEAMRQKLEKEQTHYQNALSRINLQLQAADDADKAAILEKKAQIETQLAKIDQEFADVDYREANQRAGYVYIISNIGAFGENVYKIGMTRRLEPMDRIDELGCAAVPFNFDVHAMIFSNDAPKLEAALHQAFADRKLNFVNQRREFFRVSLDEIKRVVKENFDQSVEFIETAPAEQYRESLLLRSQALSGKAESPAN